MSQHVNIEDMTPEQKMQYGELKLRFNNWGNLVLKCIADRCTSNEQAQEAMLNFAHYIKNDDYSNYKMIEQFPRTVADWMIYDYKERAAA
jgi:hypothetical protein